MPEGRYRPLLCLVQVGVGGEIAVLDPLEGFDPAPLAAVLADPAVEVVLHAGRQDVAILRREWRTAFANVFDTQVAAGFAGYSRAGRLHRPAARRAQDPARQVGVLHALGRAAADARSSSATRARTSSTCCRSPTSSSSGWLERGRLEWAREECRAIAGATDERDPDEVWRRLPRVSGLDPRERAVARELAAWRERTARREDRPVGAIVRDPTLVELAKRQPAVAGASWPASAALGPDVVRRRARDILAAIERGRAAPPIRLEEGERLGTESVDGPAIALAEALVRARAQEAGLAYELIAARADLAPIVVAARRGRPEPEVRTLAGWRRELVGAELLELLAGRRAARASASGRVRGATDRPRRPRPPRGRRAATASPPARRPPRRAAAHVPAVALGDLLDDRQAEPGARPLAGVRGAEEAVEDVRQLVGRDARAVIADRELAAAQRRPPPSPPAASTWPRCRAGC